MTLSCNTNKWFVIYTRYRYEKRVADELTIAGYNVFLPLLETISQWSDRKKKIQKPLFNSYLFIQTSTQKIKAITLPLGSLCIVSFNGEPATVPDVQIQNLQLLLNKKEPFEILSEVIQPGAKVKITHGPLKGLIGTLNECRGLKRFIISLDVMEVNIMVTVAPQFVKKIDI